MALNTKQRKAIELLTSGQGLNLKEVAEQAGVSPKTLWNWRNGNDFTEFQEELAKINHERWQAAVDAAREGAIKLCKDGNQKMIEFVLKNEGYNPTQKVEADISTDINITIGE
jgi:transcriptional regulator with XRE-family HTH domain